MVTKPQLRPVETRADRSLVVFFWEARSTVNDYSYGMHYHDPPLPSPPPAFPIPPALTHSTRPTHAHRRLIKRTGLVLCDPCALVGGETVARSLAVRAVEAKGTVEHARVPGAGPSGGLHVFKWKTYSH